MRINRDLMAVLPAHFGIDFTTFAINIVFPLLAAKLELTFTQVGVAAGVAHCRERDGPAIVRDTRRPIGDPPTAYHGNIFPRVSLSDWPPRPEPTRSCSHCWSCPRWPRVPSIRWAWALPTSRQRRVRDRRSGCSSWPVTPVLRFLR